MKKINKSLKCSSLVVKVASRCNLNCTYCYMYNLGDETYKNQPKVMSNETVDHLLEKVKRHCINHKLDSFHFVFHGGEPLLASKDFYKYFIQNAGRVLRPTISPSFSMQTNGLLLTDSWCEILGDLGISIGISLDGTPDANDKFRVDHKGRGSHSRIVKGLKIAQKSKAFKNPPGLLCVINVKSDPIEVYEHFKSLKAPIIDFLYPDCTHDVLPFGIDDSNRYGTPFGDWMIKLFDHWFNDPSKSKPIIRQFSTIIGLILGSDASLDHIGNERNETLVIETDGGIESVDVLKVCGNGFTKAGMNVKENEIDEALATPLAQMYQLSHEKLSLKCSVCPINEVCGGGYIPHRFSKEKGFNNPSFFCNDLMKMITHVQNNILKDFPEELLEEAGVSAFTIEDVLNMIDESFLTLPRPEYINELEGFKEFSSFN